MVRGTARSRRQFFDAGHDELDNSHSADLILRASPDIIYLYDRVDQKYVFVSHRVTAVLGYSPEQLKALKGNAIEALIHKDDIAHVRIHYAKQETLRDEDVSMATYRVAHASGGYRVLRCRQKVFARAVDGTVRVILGVATDLTSQVRREREIEGLRREILTIRDEERRRIALQMHDTAIQHLIGASLLLKGIQKELSEAHPASSAIDRVQVSLSRALRDVIQPLLS